MIRSIRMLLTSQLTTDAERLCVRRGWSCTFQVCDTVGWWSYYRCNLYSVRIQYTPQLGTTGCIRCAPTLGTKWRRKEHFISASTLGMKTVRKYSEPNRIVFYIWTDRIRIFEQIRIRFEIRTIKFENGKKTVGKWLTVFVPISNFVFRISNRIRICSKIQIRSDQM